MRFAPKRKKEEKEQIQSQINLDIEPSKEKEVIDCLETIQKEMDFDDLKLLAKLVKSRHKETALDELRKRKHYFII